jgi:F-type H+-transporting ATPase subunit delta
MGSAATVADRYARAIFELGVEDSSLQPLTEQLQSFAATYAAELELRSVLENPVVPADKRDAVLRQVATSLHLGPIALNAVRYLAARRRLSILPEIAKRLASLADEAAGVARAEVTSAGPLPEAFYSRLAEELGTLVGRKVVLERRQDPSLIAGVVTRIGDNTIDGSLKGRLEELGRRLLA